MTSPSRNLSPSKANRFLGSYFAQEELGDLLFGADMSLTKIFVFLSNIGTLLTLTGQFLGALKNNLEVDRNSMSQDSSNPNNGVEDEKPAEEEVYRDY